jgi:hypothetical protein
MAVGVPSTNQTIPFSTEALAQRSKIGQPIQLSGTLYQQFQQYNITTGAATTFTVINNAIAGPTSIINKAAPSATLTPSYQGDVIIPATGLQWGGSLGLTPQNGAAFRGRFYGLITTGATTALAIIVSLKNSAGSILWSVTVPATVIVSLTSATFETEFFFQVQNYNASFGTVSGYAGFKTATAAGISVITTAAAPITTGSLDTTQSTFIDVTATTSALAGTLVINGGLIEVLS